MRQMTGVQELDGREFGAFGGALHGDRGKNRFTPLENRLKIDRRWRRSAQSAAFVPLQRTNPGDFACENRI